MSSKKLSATPRRPPATSAKEQFIDAGPVSVSAPVEASASAELEADIKREERVVVYLTKEELKRIRLYAVQQDVKLTHLFRDAVMRLMDEQDG